MVDLSLVKPNHLWYAIGLIATDGNLSKDGRHINLTSKDKDLLDGIKEVLFLKNKLTKKARAKEGEKKYYFLQFGDVKFYKYLLRIGLTPHKSLTLKELTIPKDFFVDFLRGVIDGDGSINTWIHKTNGHRQWALRISSGSPVFSNWLKQSIEEFIGARGKIYGYKYPGKKMFFTL